MENEDQNGAPGVAVIGLAGVFPGAADCAALWRLLREGRDAITRFAPDEIDPAVPPAERDDPRYVRARGILPDADKFDAAFFGISPRLAEMMDPQQRIFLELAWAALEDAGCRPAGFDGLIGVYAGVGNNSYYPTSLHGRRDLVDALGAFQVMLANEKDYVATRTAYHLDLRGPGVSVHTACSTSLVAVIEGVHSLLGYRSDLILAGGVTVTAPQRSGYLAQDGDIYSTDGVCRPFDAAASGTVFSNGGGVVVLKRLDEARRDRDRIYAVIRGVGLNNDGQTKVSFGAPSVSGQAGAVAMALAQAGWSAADVSYVEAHGTGTLLGDPVEVEALTQAYRAHTARRQFCVIGSIKGNVGHLTAAAGVAGLIKTCLALRHRELPPTIHFERPNPAIDFEASPFRVTTAPEPWTAAGPLRAGVSSFGVGGTNAHVVLEEAPPDEMPPASAKPRRELLVLSAKTPDALNAATARLAARLGASDADQRLADVAWSLLTGRQPFAQRRFAVAGDPAEAAAALETVDPARTGTRRVTHERPEVAFLFPGQGSQYPGMGRAWYDREPVFRDAVDRCAVLLKPHLDGLDLRELLLARDPDAEAVAALEQTRLAQPAIFVIAYALAALWRHWGVTPVAMIGHSIGEFVCACLAEVFSLEDALALVAARGRLMQAMPPGRMLSVRRAAETVTPLLTPDLALAAINGPGLCVVSGAAEAIAALETRLNAMEVSCKPLRTSHAFHSPMMDPVVAPFEALLRAMTLRAPRVPFVSTATGRGITDAEATDPAYWAGHLRATVRFAEAVQTLWSAAPERVLLEVGPGTTAATLARQQAAEPARQLAVSSFGAAGRPEEDEAALLRALGQLWSADVAIDWNAYFDGVPVRRVTLPTYPFARTRHWIEALPAEASAPTGAAPAPDATATAASPAEAANADAPPRERLLARLRELLEDASGLDLAGAPESATLLELGFDSLSLTQLALTLKRTFGIELTFRQLLEQVTSLGALADRIEASGSAAAASPAMPATAGAPASEAEAPLPSATPEPAARPKVFGAGARIELGGGQSLTPRQETVLRRFIADYTRRTAQSKSRTAEHRPHLADPRVVSGFRPAIKEIIYPIVVERSEGSRLWDVDGNAYVDLTCGFGSNFFGNRAPFITAAIREQLEQGYEIGPQHPLTGETAALMCELTGMQRAAFCNTGSEAVLGAMRLARTVTGRSRIAAFAGAYHGILDEVIVRPGRGGRAMPGAPGIPPEAVANMLILEYGAPESLDVLRAQAGDLAAVLVEPVQSRRPSLQPREFLHEVRAITAAAGTAMVMDEVITGFRIHQGGAQAWFDVRGDLATYGKVVGGGMPIGVIAGARRFMDALDGGAWQFGDDSVPGVGVTYFAGTFVRHPLTLAAARAALLYLKAQGPALQEGLNRRTDAFVAALQAEFQAHDTPICIGHCGSLFKVMGTDDIPHGDLFYAWMRHKGVHIWDHRPCFLTLAHSDADLEYVIQAVRATLTEMRAAGFLGARLADARPDAEQPPLPGARLGRDPEGRPGWYVADSQRPGRFLRVDEEALA